MQRPQREKLQLHGRGKGPGQGKDHGPFRNYYTYDIYKDSEVGLNCAIVNNNCIEQSMDDDVASDEEILRQAKNSCIRDMFEAIKKYDTLGSKFLNNYRIIDRCNHPRFYDRNGLYRESRVARVRASSQMIDLTDDTNDDMIRGELNKKSLARKCNSCTSKFNHHKQPQPQESKYANQTN